MNAKFALTSILLLLSLAFFAQDKIYKKEGKVIDAKVKSIGTSTIIYTLPGESNEVEYTILKNGVSKIIYENGTSDNFEKGLGRTDNAGKKDYNKYGKNILTIIPGAYTAEILLNTMNDPGIGFCYERLLDDKGHFGFVLPFLYSFSSERNFENDYFYNYNSMNFNKSGFHSMMVAPGMKFYPAACNYNIRYAFGASFFLLMGNEPYAAYDRTYSGPNMNATWNYAMYGMMISNSVNMSLSRNFYMELGVNGGLPFSDNRRSYHEDVIDNILSPMLQFYLKTGVRF